MYVALSEPVTAMVVDRESSRSWAAVTVTLQGWRSTHEDRHILRHAGDGAEDWGVFAVLDGHGGDTAAEMACAMLEERLVELARQGTLDPASAVEALQDAFIQADALLRERLDHNDNSGTTVVSAIITEPQPSVFCIQLAHCGDSRAVLCSGNKLTCSVDHKPELEDEVRRIEAAGGIVLRIPLRVGRLRVDGVLAVSRALGDFEYKTPGLAPSLCKVSAVPAVATITGCAPGDWLLLACDGVFDVVSNDEVHDFVSTRIRQVAPCPADGATILVDLLKFCLSRGSRDNITASLVQLRADGTAQPKSRELLQGSWAKASPEVRARYAEFFRTYGFEAEARQVAPPARRAPAPPPARPPAAACRAPAPPPADPDLQSRVNATRSTWLKRVQANGMELGVAPATYRADKEIALAAVRQSGWALQFVSESLKADLETVLAAVEGRGRALRHAAGRLLANRQVALAAVQASGHALELVAEDLKADREIVLAAVRQDGSALAYADEELRKDREVVLAAIRQSSAAVNLAGALWQDAEIRNIVAQQHGDSVALRAHWGTGATAAAG